MSPPMARIRSDSLRMLLTMHSNFAPRCNHGSRTRPSYISMPPPPFDPIASVLVLITTVSTSCIIPSGLCLGRPRASPLFPVPRASRAHRPAHGPLKRRPLSVLVWTDHRTCLDAHGCRSVAHTRGAQEFLGLLRGLNVTSSGCIDSYTRPPPYAQPSHPLSQSFSSQSSSSFSSPLSIMSPTVGPHGPPQVVLHASHLS